MSRLWKWYQNCLHVHPYKTQIISSGILWAAGDMIAQTVSHNTKKDLVQYQGADEEFKINWRRVASTSLFGFGFIGPVGHVWYEGLDRLIRGRLQLQPNSLRFVASKVGIDGVLFGPLYILTFFSYMGLASGKSIAVVKEDVKRDFLPALGVGAVIAPLFQVINFRYIPVRYQLTFVNGFCLLDSALLSWIDQQENAPWKKWFTSLLVSEEEEKENKEKEKEGEVELLATPSQ
ncbi:hypothetical protein AQUCO_00100456v1 [Aquilegia coerulea]|uniref:Peroxisomal membrane protein MPV17 n=1 Tax=Aquilegia coerulea TaxID=218851 RepID=A0A2G5FAR3_AQUCA|nr:hypothetical protein AQUCO_00100456v1 [Aquilegia coerulea]